MENTPAVWCYGALQRPTKISISDPDGRPEIEVTPGPTMIDSHPCREAQFHDDKSENKIAVLPGEDGLLLYDGLG
ncbi:hypothetical protein QC762_0023190 [Podospora pseudocomata]|uniref:Uncharacterized protein n=1 Tax=Podospora pseudocomata TaxID=2093779 RepID=A0ABR0GYH2_9PEZI|nr:hypothetical protein QC762_0023190 [Podospora pseudocomata]